MTAGRWVRDGVLVVVALVLQVTLVARLPVPGSPPDLVLVVVLGLALTRGVQPGAVLGFAVGCLADLQADHPLGRLALAYVVAAAVVGVVAGRTPDAVRAVAAVVVAAAAAVGAYALEGLVLSDPRASLAALVSALSSSTLYAAALATVVVPAVAVVSGRAREERGGWGS